MDALLLSGLARSGRVRLRLIRRALDGKLFPFQSLFGVKHVAQNKRFPLLREPYRALADCFGSPTPHHDATPIVPRAAGCAKAYFAVDEAALASAGRRSRW